MIEYLIRVRDVLLGYEWLSIYSEIRDGSGSERSCWRIALISTFSP